MSESRQRSGHAKVMLGAMHDDADACYRAISSRDPRFDGRFVTAVTTTGIYCRPVCPAQTPLRSHVRFLPTGAAAEAAGYRACRRCRPQLTPAVPGGEPLATRALALIAAGSADGGRGVNAVAALLGIGERQLHRVLQAAVGMSPLALARMRRLQTARVLLEQTELPAIDVALTSGFGSLRQFNDAVRHGLGATPTELRRRGGVGMAGDGAIVLRLGVQPPFDGRSLLRFLAARALPGVEAVTDQGLVRSLRLEHGAAVVQLRPERSAVLATLWLDDIRDLGGAVCTSRAMVDADVDPGSIAAALETDPLLGPLVRARPGLRIPGGADGAEVAVRAILGQQVSTARGAALGARLVALAGAPLPHPRLGLTRLFPTPHEILDANLDGLGLTGERAATLRRLAATLAAEPALLRRGAESATAAARLRAIRGIGPWTVAYVAMRGLGDPDAFPAADLGVRRAFVRLGGGAPAALSAHAARWRPWRAYATMHLWSAGNDPAKHTEMAA